MSTKIGLFHLPTRAQQAVLDVVQRYQDSDPVRTAGLLRECQLKVVQSCRRYGWLQQGADRLTEHGAKALSVASGDLGWEVRASDLCDRPGPRGVVNEYLDEAHEVLVSDGWLRLTRVEIVLGYAILYFDDHSNQRAFNVALSRKLRVRKALPPQDTQSTT